ncbi:MAG TPA: histidine kinase dimerization/phospho-acceptor domain-containing protein [Gammaproteobacteria bacterium]|nr:histidine kinase dimerization/phospho-acceptor domain-containing protein [Gammaproteobacteria bacterium]
MLREANRRKDEFLATLAHELRNPLALLRNALEILRVREGDRRSVSRIRETMEYQGDHLARW